jgi:hypothetical protein
MGISSSVLGALEMRAVLFSNAGFKDGEASGIVPFSMSDEDVEIVGKPNTPLPVGNLYVLGGQNPALLDGPSRELMEKYNAGKLMDVNDLVNPASIARFDRSKSDPSLFDRIPDHLLWLADPKWGCFTAHRSPGLTCLEPMWVDEAKKLALRVVEDELRSSFEEGLASLAPEKWIKRAKVAKTFWALATGETEIAQRVGMELIEDKLANCASDDASRQGCFEQIISTYVTGSAGVSKKLNAKPSERALSHYKAYSIKDARALDPPADGSIIGVFEPSPSIDPKTGIFEKPWAAYEAQAEGQYSLIKERQRVVPALFVIDPAATPRSNPFVRFDGYRVIGDVEQLIDRKHGFKHSPKTRGQIEKQLLAVQQANAKGKNYRIVYEVKDADLERRMKAQLDAWGLGKSGLISFKVVPP